MIDWNQIHTVFLDMDGTLLDLNFDNHFWLEHVPSRYAEHHGISIDEAKDIVFPRYHKVAGTMDWYCIDYWTRELGMDISVLKEEVDHLIAVHPYVPDFLSAVKRANKRLVLVTNAHGKSLALKMRRTQLGGYFDNIICAHDYGVPKEDESFWARLQAKESFEPRQTLLVDDSLPVLRSARDYGIEYLLAVYRPDTTRPAKDVEEFEAINSFIEIMPVEKEG